MTTKECRLFSHIDPYESLDVDNTCFEPTRLTLLSGKHFQTKYQSQLESLIVIDDPDKLKLPDLLTMVTIHNLLLEAKGKPLLAVTKRHQRYKKEINDGMNWFFKRYRLIIKQMDMMLNGKDVNLPDTVESD